jgi:hypothetical protein
MVLPIKQYLYNAKRMDAEILFFLLVACKKNRLGANSLMPALGHLPKFESKKKWFFVLLQKTIL